MMATRGTGYDGTGSEDGQHHPTGPTATGGGLGGAGGGSADGGAGGVFGGTDGAGGSAGGGSADVAGGRAARGTAGGAAGGLPGGLPGSAGGAAGDLVDGLAAGDPAVGRRPADVRHSVTRFTAATVLSLGIVVAVNSVAVAGSPYRWWANFIMVPALVLLTLSVGLPRAARETRFVLAWIGAIVLTVALLLIAGRMGAYWPLMIVVPCLGPAGLFALRPTDGSLRAFVDTVAGLAIVGVALGVAFLLIRADTLNPGNHHWWGWFMLAAAAVPGANGLILLANRRGTYWFSMAVLLIALGGYTTLAAIAELNR